MSDKFRKGRGAGNNPQNRFQQKSSETIDDGWDSNDDSEKLTTELFKDVTRTVISYNQSPDVPFDRSINPYRGCEHGCVYCFARPSHAYLDCSPGLDFESKIFYKPEAAKLLGNELGKKHYQCKPIALGVNTDAYQPAERKLKVTRSILETLNDCSHPVGIVTKSSLIERDIDLLAEMAERNLCHVMISLTTLDSELCRLMEPRTSPPQRRLEIIRTLRQRNIPVGVLMAPIIPILNDQEIETILESAHEAGAMVVGYTLIRLPYEVKTLFKDWLQHHYPLKANHIMNRIQDSRGGKDYDASFSQRMKGTGIFAELIQKRFQRAEKQLGFTGLPAFDNTAFSPPQKETPQMQLW